MSAIIVNGDTSGSVTLQAPAIAGSTVITLPANSMNIGNGGGGISTNTVFGASALNSNTTGAPNDAFGFQALYNNTTGYNNVAVGYQSMYTNSTGDSNVAVGASALASNTSGRVNTAVGGASLTANTIGSNNTAVGQFALGGNTTGSNNVAIGQATLSGAGTGSNNIALGVQSLGVATGGNNVAIGYQAAFNTTALTTGTGNVVIGYAARTSTAGGVNQIVIGNGGVGQGDNYVSIGTGGTNYIYALFTSSATWTKASDARIKANIEPAPDKLGLDLIKQLNVKTYNWKPSNEIPEDIIGYSEENTQDTDSVMYGMIAQEVKSALDDLGIEHFAGWNVREADGLQGLSNEMFVLPLINAVKELATQNQELKARIEALEGAK